MPSGMNPREATWCPESGLAEFPVYDRGIALDYVTLELSRSLMNFSSGTVGSTHAG